jgi:hypothetical protein
MIAVDGPDGRVMECGTLDELVAAYVDEAGMDEADARVYANQCIIMREHPDMYPDS